VALGDFSPRKSICDFPSFFSIFFWFFFSPFWFLLLLRVVCALKAQFLFPCLFVLSPSLLDDDGVCNCLNKSAVTIIFVVFVFFLRLCFHAVACCNSVVVEQCCLGFLALLFLLLVYVTSTRCDAMRSKRSRDQM